jgi:hypothetical protein
VYTTFWQENQKRRYNLWGLYAYGRILLKLISKKKAARVWNDSNDPMGDLYEGGNGTSDFIDHKFVD